jgi:hypothetical protein
MYPLTQKAKGVVDRLVEAFDSPEILVDTITRATLIANNSPCMKWSFTNRFIVALHGTGDARGFRQWKEANRSVTKGAKAMYILVPRFRKVADDEDEQDSQALSGFIAAPVFRIEDTDGEPLPGCVPREIPKLQVVADALGVPVTYTGAVSENVFGAYSHEKEDADGESGKITLYTHDLSTFHHELSHAIHHRTGMIRGVNSKAGRRDNEIVAEISAAVLMQIFEGQDVGRQAIRYVKDYGAVKSRLLSLLPEIMEVVELAIRVAEY